MASQCRVTLAGPHVAVDRPVTESTALQILGVLAGESGSVPQAGGAPSGGAPVGGRPPATAHGIRAYLDADQAADIVRKITVIGGYLASLGQDSFTSKDLLAQFDAAKEAAPKNISRDI